MLKEKRDLGTNRYYGNHVETIIMSSLVHLASLQSLSQFGQICMIFSFVTIPCTTNDVMTQIL